MNRPLLFATALLVLAAPLRADVTLPVIPPAVFKVTAYGAVGDGTTDSTTAIQNAIRAAQTAGGGTVELPAAAAPYLAGPLTVGSNINFQVDAGATLQLLPYAGTNAPGTYPLTGSTYANFLTFAGNNVALTGGGTIEGNGAAWWAAYTANNAMPHRPYLIRFNSANFVLLKDITLRNSPMFHVSFNATHHVTVDGITIFAPTTSVNTDGVDPAGSHYLIKNCNISTGDDNICLKPQSTFCSDITIANCTFGTGHGLSVGGQTNSGLDGLVVVNCTFNGTTSGIRLKADPTEGGLVQNLSYSNLTMTNVQYPIVFYSYYDQVGNPGSVSGSTQTTVAKVTAWNATPPTSAYQSYRTATMPTWRNITVNHLTATRTTGANGYSIIWGLPNLPIDSVTLNDVQITNYAGFEIFNAQNIQFTGGTTLSGLVTHNAQILATPPAAQFVAPGATARFTATLAAATTAAGAVTPTYQWSFNGQPLVDGTRSDGSSISGATTASLAIGNAQASATGFYTVTTTAALDSYTAGALAPGASSARMTTAPAALTVGTAGDIGRLFNLSARASVGLDANALIAGFVIGGAGNSGVAKKLLVRGIGPGLAAYLDGVLADPMLQIVNAGSGAAVTTNDNWGGDANVAAVSPQVGAFPLTNSASLDAALVVSFPPVGYTATLSGRTGGTGIGLLELYDASGPGSATAPRLINVSARAQVTAGAGALIAGFVIDGTAPKTVLIRGIGPGLAAYGVPGVLADPVVQVYVAGTNFVALSNDNWCGESTVSVAATKSGAFALPDPGSRDAALMTSLPPGSYTAVLSGTGTSSGVALVEVYEVP